MHILFCFLCLFPLSASRSIFLESNWIPMLLLLFFMNGDNKIYRFIEQTCVSLVYVLLMFCERFHWYVFHTSGRARARARVYTFCGCVCACYVVCIPEWHFRFRYAVRCKTAWWQDKIYNMLYTINEWAWFFSLAFFPRFSLTCITQKFADGTIWSPIVSI